jgi:hypothetical protein
MTGQKKSARTRAEEHFNKAQKTHEVATALIDKELQAVRSKTARLRAARLAKEAEEGLQQARHEKPTARKRETARR